MELKGVRKDIRLFDKISNTFSFDRFTIQLVRISLISNFL